MSETTYQPSDHIYWAAEDPDRIADAVRAKFLEYIERVRRDGRLEMWRTADRCYHGRNPDGASYSNAHAVTFGGTRGEVAQLHVGHFRQLVRSMHTLATQQRPAIEATAVSNDPEAISDTIVARQVLEYDLDEQGLEQALYATHERALVYAEGYAVQVWDFHAGEEIGTRQIGPDVVDASADGLPGVEAGAEPMPMGEGDSGEPMVEAGPMVDVPVREGEVRIDVRSPLDVARDLDLDRADEQPWYIVRTRVHRWELAARFPEDGEKRDAILDAVDAESDDATLWERTRGTKSVASDYVHVLSLYHPPSDALPQGRLVEVVGDVVLFDGPYPYDHQVVHADIPSAELDRTTGYGDAWDMLAISQALDAVESGMLSVFDAGSLINFLAARGQKVDSRQLDTGMTVIEYDDNGLPGSKPPGLAERAEVRDSDFKLSEHYRQALEIISGINATTRGVAESEVKSGADRALIATMAVQANSAQQRSYANLVRSVLNGRLALYKAFAQGERLIEIAGRDKSGHVASFTAKTLESVRRVRVELGPADLRTVEGKMHLADNMLERYGPETITPDRYMALRMTGRLDDLDNATAEHKVNARRENDMCREGRGDQLLALVSDNHAIHIAEHVRELNDPAIRFGGESDPARAQQIATLTMHITQHAQLWATAAPEILAATGQAPAPSTLMGGPPGGAPMGAPAGGPPPMPPGEGPPPAPEAVAGPQGPDMPQMPIVPGTGGERFEPGMPPPAAGGVQ